MSNILVSGTIKIPNDAIVITSNVYTMCPNLTAEFTSNKDAVLTIADYSNPAPTNVQANNYQLVQSQKSAISFNNALLGSNPIHIYLPVPDIGLKFYLSYRGTATPKGVIRFSDGTIFRQLGFQQAAYIVGTGTSSHDWGNIH